MPPAVEKVVFLLCLTCIPSAGQHSHDCDQICLHNHQQGIDILSELFGIDFCQAFIDVGARPINWLRDVDVVRPPAAGHEVDTGPAAPCTTWLQVWRLSRVQE